MTKTDIELILDLKNDINNLESFKALFNRYYSVLGSLKAKYSAQLMDSDDWDQEARIALMACVNNFNINKGKSFGLFYKKSLTNKFFDIIRKFNAQKRKADGPLKSIDDNFSYYASTIEDVFAQSPERMLITRESLKKVMKMCSKKERQTLEILMNTKTGLANFKDDRSFHNACDRCRWEFRDHCQELGED